MTSFKKKAAKRVISADAKVAEATEPVARTRPVAWLGKASEIADQPQLRILAATIVTAGLVTTNDRLARAGVRMLLAHELATFVKGVIKHRIDRTRPRSAQSKTDRAPKPGNSRAKEQSSFPSGHSAGATAAALAFAAEYPERRGTAMSGALAASIVQVPRSAHYLTDVAAGLAIGALSGVAANLLFDSVPGRHNDARRSLAMARGADSAMA